MLALVSEYAHLVEENEQKNASEMNIFIVIIKIFSALFLFLFMCVCSHFDMVLNLRYSL